MALDLFRLRGVIEADNKKAINALDEVSNKGQKTQSKLSKAFGAIGKGAAVVGKTIVTGLAAGGAAVAGLTAKALSASGELEQNMGGSEAVFGQYAARIQRTAKDAFANMGLSTSDFLATANKMGALFQGAGFSIAQSSGLASSAMQRAADVASIMGIDTSAAMEAIAGAAKGNFTMMDNLGVAMNDTTLNAYALEKGINKTTQEMTNQEKIALAMEMFMDKTAYAAGNYAKENETLAGSLGTAKSALTNFLDGSGSVEDLVSSFGNLANVAVKSLKEILPRLTTGLTDIVNQIMPMIPPLLDQLLPSIIEGATGLINGLVSAIPSIITTLMDALPALIEGILSIMDAIVTNLPIILDRILAELPSLVPMLIDGVVQMIVTLCTVLPQIIQPIIDNLPTIITAIVDALLQNLPALIDGVVQLVVGIVDALPTIILTLLDYLPEIIVQVVNGLLGALPTLIEGVGQIIMSVTAAMWELLASLPESLGNFVKTLWGNLSNIISGVWEAIKTYIKTVITVISTNISTVWKGIWNTLKGIVNGISDTISGVFNGIKDAVSKVWNKIKSAIIDPITQAKDKVGAVIDIIKGFFSGMKLEFPNIKLPHFTVKPSGWKIGDLLKGSIPSLDIEWYAKAMQNPIVMTKPTIWGYDPKTGNLQGGGEAGTEVVSGTNTLMRMIQSAVATQNDTLAYYLQMLIDILADYFPQILEGVNNPRPAVLGDPDYVARQLASPMNYHLGRLSTQKERGR
jgi:phage-related protein